MDHPAASEDILVGVEEEFLLVDADSGLPAPRIAEVIRDAEALIDQAQEELHRAQIESASRPCGTLSELRAELVGLRAKLVRAAAGHGAMVVPSASFPSAMGRAGRLVTDEDRYQDMLEANAQLVREQLICGCHIPVSVPDPDLAIVIMNRIRRWLPLLLALSANSPFWDGEDTGFASYRTEVWWRWPTAGPPGTFADSAEYLTLLSQLVEAGVILDEGMAYWDVRPSQRFPTLEIRIADVMPDIDDVVLVAALARALVVWCQDPAYEDGTLRPELLRAAAWRAARSGITGDLIDPLDASVRPARTAVDELLGHLRRGLETREEYEEVRSLAARVVARGTGASRQRAAFGVRGEMADLLDAVRLR
jgi:carboxylate-amine ligase